MNKDYQPSQKYSLAEIQQFDIPYMLQDSCVDFLYELKVCQSEEQNIFKTLGVFSGCKKQQRLFKNCQKQREREITDKYDKMEKDLRRQKFVNG